MNTKLKVTTGFIIYLISSLIAIHGQVTIGSGIEPNKGALLDLKEYNADTPGGETSKHGFLLPRVNLVDKDKLQMGTNPELTGDERNNHTGLVVFNVNETAPFCKGVYVWNGQEWLELGDLCAGAAGSTSITLSPDTEMFFLSGQNGSSIIPKNIQIAWNPASATTSMSETPVLGTGMGLTSNPTFPLGNNTGTSVYIRPNTMSQTEVGERADGGNPFLIKKSKMNFIVNNNGITESKSIDVTQLNKAILINNKLNPDRINYQSSSANQTVTVESNYKWKLAVTPTANSMVTITSPTNLNASYGSELNDGTSDASTSVTYNVTTGSTRSRFNFLTFSDASDEKRFNDVLLTLTQCDSEKEMSMTDWKNYWEATYGIDPANDEPNSIGDATKNVNEVMWHRDQNGNIFFSAVFGNDPNSSDGKRRWMITNLAATIFDPVRTSGDNTVPRNFQTSGTYRSPASPNVYNYPMYCYPNKVGNLTTSATAYNNRPRLGLLYNWAAATNSKGGTSNGKQNVDGAINESQFAEGSNSTTQQKRRQGICPGGWHLPSDLEWTNLENEVHTNTSRYSNTPDISTALPTGLPNDAFSMHAQIAVPLTDMCEGRSTNYGTSKNMLEGGMNLLTTGFGGNNTESEVTQVPNAAYNFGTIGYYWTSSSRKSDLSWYRYMMNISAFDGLRRDSAGRTAFFSVRCVKD